MTESFGVTPEKLRAVARRLSDLSTRERDVLASLQDNLASEGPAWGGDKIGDQFAKDYLPPKDWVDGTGEAQARFLKDLSQGVKTAADSFEQQDGG